MIYRKIKSVIQLLLIVPISFLIANDTLFDSIKLLATANENLDKALQEQVIINKQQELAVITEKENQAIEKTDKKSSTNTRVEKTVVTEKKQIKEEIKAIKQQSKKTKVVSSTQTNPQVISTFKGELTAYTATCSGCSGVLACHTENGSRYVVSKNGIYYNDSKYGNVRIVATSSNYKCGTILKFNLRGTQVNAVAMDRGVSGNVVDLLTTNVKDAYKIGRISNFEFQVLRVGW